MEFPVLIKKGRRGVIQFCGVSRGEAVFSGISRGKNIKLQNFTVPYYGWGSIASRLQPL